MMELGQPPWNVSNRRNQEHGTAITTTTTKPTNAVSQATSDHMMRSGFTSVTYRTLCVYVDELFQNAAIRFWECERG